MDPVQPRPSAVESPGWYEGAVGRALLASPDLSHSDHFFTPACVNLMIRGSVNSLNPASGLSPQKLLLYSR